MREQQADVGPWAWVYWSFHKYVSSGSEADGGLAYGGSALAGEPQSLKKTGEKAHYLQDKQDP